MFHLRHPASNHRSKAKRRYARDCNLCGHSFIASVPHRCFCDGCKTSSDLYRFHDWLPDAPPEISENIFPMKMKRADGKQAA